jgi:hypothetical protein
MTSTAHLTTGNLGGQYDGGLLKGIGNSLKEIPC